jgi:dihydropteroate synthase
MILEQKNSLLIMKAVLGRLSIGKGEGVKVMGIINASPESFYKTSVRISDSEIASAAAKMKEDGAQIIDVGGMSTAPYIDAMISVEEEITRMKRAIRAIKDGCDLPISADTPRADVAEVAIRSGVDAINDVTGLKYDPKMARVVADADVAVIVGAYSQKIQSGAISATIRVLKQSLELAKHAGIASKRLIVDPSVGFFREQGKGPFFTKISGMPWYARDIETLSDLQQIVRLAPTCVSVSGKSFLGELMNIREPEKRLIPSLACEIFAILEGASIVRTHHVRETVEALTMTQVLSRSHTANAYNPSSKVFSKGTVGHP